MGTERLSGLLKITQLANRVVSDSELAQCTALGETHDYHAHSMFHGQQSALRKAQCHLHSCFFREKKRSGKQPEVISVTLWERRGYG